MLARHRFSSWSSSSSSKTSSSPALFLRRDKNPYAILGVPLESDYDTVKRAFLTAALHHHPDRTNGSHQAFIRYRKAFDEVIQLQQQQQQQRDSVYDTEDSDLEPYFRNATSDFLTFNMDDATRKEVIQAYHTMDRGADMDGRGYWEMARQLAERELFHNDEDNLGLPAGHVRVSTCRRKRKL